MSRMRQIPAMDVSQRDRMLEQNQSATIKNNTRAYPPVYNNTRPVQAMCRPRMRKPPAAKFRLSDAPALISTGCSSVRQLCSNVQNITMDLNNLMGSVESMVPLINTYLTVLQNRTAIPEQEPEPPIEILAKACSPRHEEPHTAQTNAQTEPSTSTAVPPMPRPEDMKALLENPVVRNLLTGLMQNGAFPNISAMKENTPHQS